MADSDVSNAPMMSPSRVLTRRQRVERYLFLKSTGYGRKPSEDTTSEDEVPETQQTMSFEQWRHFNNSNSGYDETMTLKQPLHFNNSNCGRHGHKSAAHRPLRHLPEQCSGRAEHVKEHKERPDVKRISVQRPDTCPAPHHHDEPDCTVPFNHCNDQPPQFDNSCSGSAEKHEETPSRGLPSRELPSSGLPSRGIPSGELPSSGLTCAERREDEDIDHSPFHMCHPVPATNRKMNLDLPCFTPRMFKLYPELKRLDKDFVRHLEQLYNVAYQRQMKQQKVDDMMRMSESLHYHLKEHIGRYEDFMEGKYCPMPAEYPYDRPRTRCPWSNQPGRRRCEDRRVLFEPYRPTIADVIGAMRAEHPVQRCCLRETNTIYRREIPKLETPKWRRVRCETMIEEMNKPAPRKRPKEICYQMPPPTVYSLHLPPPCDISWPRKKLPAPTTLPPRKPKAGSKPGSKPGLKPEPEPELGPECVEKKVKPVEGKVAKPPPEPKSEPKSKPKKKKVPTATLR